MLSETEDQESPIKYMLSVNVRETWTRLVVLYGAKFFTNTCNLFVNPLLKAVVPKLISKFG